MMIIVIIIVIVVITVATNHYNNNKKPCNPDGRQDMQSFLQFQYCLEPFTLTLSV